MLVFHLFDESKQDELKYGTTYYKPIMTVYGDFYMKKLLRNPSMTNKIWVLGDLVIDVCIYGICNGAYIDHHGNRFHFNNGYLQNEMENPAISYANGDYAYVTDRMLHRLDGPALTDWNNLYFFYMGEQVTKEILDQIKLNKYIYSEIIKEVKYLNDCY